MEVKNVGGTPVVLKGITRYVDLDVDNSITGDVYDRTGDSITARETSGISLTGLSDFPVTSVQPFGATNWEVCDQGSVATPTPAGDHTGRVNLPFNYTLAPNALEKAVFLLRR